MRNVKSNPQPGNPSKLYRSIEKRVVHWFFSLPTIALEKLVPPGLSLAEVIMDDICLPPHVKHYKHDDVRPVLSIVRAFQPNRVIELGTAYGNLTANICRQCSTARVYTVNAPAAEQSGDVVTFELSPQEIGRVYRQHDFGKQVVQIFQNTLKLDLSEHLQPGTVDLAIIDACHDTDYVINDFVKVAPYMRPQGVVLFHDTHPSMRGHLRGSYLACAGLRRRGYDIRQIENSWWAVWVNGSFQPLTPCVPAKITE